MMSSFQTKFQIFSRMGEKFQKLTNSQFMRGQIDPNYNPTVAMGTKSINISLMYCAINRIRKEADWLIDKYTQIIQNC